MTKSEPTVYCDFCDKSQHEVKQMVQGPKDAAICNKCVDLCVEIIAGKVPKEPA